MLGTAIKETRCNVHSKQYSAKTHLLSQRDSVVCGHKSHTHTTLLRALTDGHQRCRTTAPAAASTLDCVAPQSVGRPARWGAISALLLASCAASLAAVPLSKDPRLGLTCIQGNSCDNTGKDFFERTPHQLLRLLLHLTEQSYLQFGRSLRDILPEARNVPNFSQFYGGIEININCTNKAFNYITTMLLCCPALIIKQSGHFTCR